MTKKLSPQKMSKIMTLYFQGWSQTEIANKLGVDQSTISLYAGKLKTMALEKGMKTAAEEYGITDTVEALHSLGAELKKNGLTVEEAWAGLKMELFFQKLGIKQEQYSQLINACKKMKEEGFIVAAIKLAHLEESTGTTYEQLLAHYGAVQKDLAGATGELQAATDKLATLKKEVAAFEKQKTAAGEQLQSYMKQVGVDTQRIKLVENLAKALKDGGIPDGDIELFIQHQQALNKAGFDTGWFTAILDKLKFTTALDHGKGLLKSLSEYGSLTEVCAGLQAEAKALKGQVAGLEQQAALKGKIEVEVSKLKAEKAGLEPHVADLQTQYQTMVILQNEIAALAPKKETLAQKIGELETRAAELNADIEIKEKKVADLKEVESKRADLLKEITDTEVRVKKDQMRWDIFQGFLGLVHATSRDELKKSASEVYEMVGSLPEKPSVQAIDYYKNYILKDLTGGNVFFSLKCQTCGVSIIMDKTRPTGSYQCPNGEPFKGSPHQVIVEKNTLAVFKAALSPKETKHTIPVQHIDMQGIEPKNTDGKA
jgi:predicted transcriptional regulator/predicted  nucleic acid-binding Zn-ribbon protein